MLVNFINIFNRIVILFDETRLNYFDEINGFFFKKTYCQRVQ